MTARYQSGKPTIADAAAAQRRTKMDLHGRTQSDGISVILTEVQKTTAVKWVVLTKCRTCSQIRWYFGWMALAGTWARAPAQGRHDSIVGH